MRLPFLHPREPLVENAIVHGVESVKNGTIHLKVFHDESKVYLQVRNTGKKMTEEDIERIHAILEGDESKITKVPGRHTSIGIQNDTVVSSSQSGSAVILILKSFDGVVVELKKFPWYRVILFLLIPTSTNLRSAIVLSLAS